MYTHVIAIDNVTLASCKYEFRRRGSSASQEVEDILEIEEAVEELNGEGGDEHRAPRYNDSQISLHQKDEYLKYREDMSKTNQGGLKHLRVKPKCVRIYRSEDPERCHIRLHKLNMRMSPTSGRDGVFYLTPLQKPQGQVWFSRQAVGHNTLQRMVPDIAKAAGMQGHYTNHSLRSTAATTLFQAGVDEQLIMKQTGHRSVSGVRSYKRENEDQMKMMTQATQIRVAAEERGQDTDFSS